jgi:hypothetical protein
MPRAVVRGGRPWPRLYGEAGTGPGQVLHFAPMRITRIRVGALASLSAAAVVAALAVGCGGGGDDVSDTPAGRAAQAYVDAYNTRDFDRVCTLLSKSYKRERELVPGSADEPEEEGELETGCAEYFKEHTTGAETTLTLLDVQQNGSAPSPRTRPARRRTRRSAWRVSRTAPGR